MREQDQKDYEIFKNVVVCVAGALGVKFKLHSDKQNDADQKFELSVAYADTPDNTITKNVSCDIRTMHDRYFTTAVNFETRSLSFNVDLGEVSNPIFSKHLLMTQAATEMISDILKG